MATPVEVSLCVSAYVSTPASATGCGWVPGGDSMTVGASSHGAAAVTLANFAENSPNDRCCALWSTRPNAAISQNAVVPPLPSTTSYPFGQPKRSAIPSRIRCTSERTGACRCEVPR